MYLNVSNHFRLNTIDQNVQGLLATNIFEVLNKKDVSRMISSLKSRLEIILVNKLNREGMFGETIDAGSS